MLYVLKFADRAGYVQYEYHTEGEKAFAIYKAQNRDRQRMQGVIVMQYDEHGASVVWTPKDN